MEVSATRTSSSDIADLNSQDAQTVCEALGRYEETLRGAVKEIHVDIQVFKNGVDRQVAEVLRLANPLASTVAELQQENQQLRTQVEHLAQQVEILSRAAGLSDVLISKPVSSTVSAASPRLGSSNSSRFASHARLSLSSKSQVTAWQKQGSTVCETAACRNHLIIDLPARVEGIPGALLSQSVALGPSAPELGQICVFSLPSPRPPAPPSLLFRPCLRDALPRCDLTSARSSTQEITDRKKWRSYAPSGNVSRCAKMPRPRPPPLSPPP